MPVYNPKAQVLTSVYVRFCSLCRLELVDQFPKRELTDLSLYPSHFVAFHELYTKNIVKFQHGFGKIDKNYILRNKFIVKCVYMFTD